jgi:hypothetical protein
MDSGFAFASLGRPGMTNRKFDAHMIGFLESLYDIAAKILRCRKGRVSNRVTTATRAA